MLNVRLLIDRHAACAASPCRRRRRTSRRIAPSTRSSPSTRASRATARPAPMPTSFALTCDGYVVNQRLRLEIAGARGTVVSEQQSQMTESRDGKKLRFEHRTTTDGRQTSLLKGEALLGDDGTGQARFTDPEGQTVALPAGTLFPVAIARETIRQAKAGESGFDALFFYRREGEAAAVGQHRDRQGAQAARRREDPRRRRAAGRRPLADLLPRRLLRSPGQGQGQTRANPPSR